MARPVPDDGLTKHARYTRTLKGQKHNRRYEDRHPERRDRARTGFTARDQYGRDGDQSG